MGLGYKVLTCSSMRPMGFINSRHSYIGRTAIKTSANLQLVNLTNLESTRDFQYLYSSHKSSELSFGRYGTVAVETTLLVEVETLDLVSKILPLHGLLR